MSRSQRLLPLLLAMLTAVGPISTDMYLPAFPSMREALHGDASAAPMTLAAWFGGLAAGQLVHGPLADRYGRRAPLLFGTVLYVLASAGCALATGMPGLILFRALAAFGGAAGLTVPRAIIRDVAEDGAHAARIVSRLQVIMSVVPMLAPTLGGLIVEAADWRAIFWVAALYGVLCAALSWRLLDETRPPGSGYRESVARIAVHYLLLLGDRSFVSHVLCGSFATFSLFAFLGGGPAIFLTHFGLRPAWFGALFIANGAGFAAGTWLNTALIAKVGHPRVLTMAAGALVAVSAGMLACAYDEVGGVWGVEGPMVAIMVILGCVLPDAAIGALGVHARDAGLASALYGTVVFAVGALGTIGAGFLDHASAVPMACLILLGACLAALSGACRPAVPVW